jgi:hypothetical protein
VQQQDVIDTLQRTRALRTTINTFSQAAHESREAVQRRRAEDAQEPSRPPDNPKEEA